MTPEQIDALKVGDKIYRYYDGHSSRIIEHTVLKVMPRTIDIDKRDPWADWHNRMRKVYLVHFFTTNAEALKSALASKQSHLRTDEASVNRLKNEIKDIEEQLRKLEG